MLWPFNHAYFWQFVTLDRLCSHFSWCKRCRFSMFPLAYCLRVMFKVPPIVLYSFRWITPFRERLYWAEKTQKHTLFWRAPAPPKATGKSGWAAIRSQSGAAAIRCASRKFFTFPRGKVQNYEWVCTRIEPLSAFSIFGLQAGAWT